MSLDFSMRVRNRRSLRRSASSARFRWVMSRAMPTSPMTRPVESRHGVLVERNTLSPSGAGNGLLDHLLDPGLHDPAIVRLDGLAQRRFVVELPVAPPHDLLGEPADGRERGRIREEDASLPVLREDRVWRGVDDLPEELPASVEVLLGPATFGDVEHDAHCPADLHPLGSEGAAPS